MKKYILLSLMVMSVSAFASVQERSEFRSELETALETIEVESALPASSAKSSWYLNRMWLEFTPYVTFQVPGIAGVKLTPNIRIYLKRALKAEDQDYKPNAM